MGRGREIHKMSETLWDSGKHCILSLSNSSNPRTASELALGLAYSKCPLESWQLIPPSWSLTVRLLTKTGAFSAMISLKVQKAFHHFFFWATHRAM